MQDIVFLGEAASFDDLCEDAQSFGFAQREDILKAASLAILIDHIYLLLPSKELFKFNYMLMFQATQYLDLISQQLFQFRVLFQLAHRDDLNREDTLPFATHFLIFQICFVHLPELSLAEHLADLVFVVRVARPACQL